MPKFIVENIQTFHEVHVIEAENEEQAKKISLESDYNASIFLGTVNADVQKFSEAKLKRWKERDTYFFDGFVSVDDGKLVYHKPDGQLRETMPTIEHSEQVVEKKKKKKNKKKLDK